MVCERFGEDGEHISMSGGQSTRSAGRVTAMVTDPPFLGGVDHRVQERYFTGVDGRSWRFFAPTISRWTSARLDCGGLPWGSTLRKTATKPAENSSSNTTTSPKSIILILFFCY